MIKPAIRMLLSTALLLGSVSITRADTYSVVSSWTTGSAQFGSLNTYTGNGTFTWSGGAFSAVSLSFIDVTTSTTLWTASPTDGELSTFSGFEHLIIGNSGTDCGLSCIAIALPSSLATGGPQVLSGVGGGASTTQMPNSTFVSATITDTTYSTPEPASIVMLLTMLGIVGYVVSNRRRLA
jgi:hypothetical protein